MINTPWGYDINAAELPTILTVEEFNTMTANKYASDSRTSSMIKSVEATVRNFVHWHLAGECECVVTYTLDDLHVTKLRDDLLIQLPSRSANSLVELRIDDHIIQPKHFLKKNGILKLYNMHEIQRCFNRYSPLQITFNSGLVDDQGVKSVIASRVSNALSGNIGISSETAGGVSISYSSAYVAGINPTTLLTADREYLLSYRIEELL